MVHIVQVKGCVKEGMHVFDSEERAKMFVLDVLKEGGTCMRWEEGKE